MPSLTLTGKAIGTVGFTIGTTIDLQAIAQGLFASLNTTFSFNLLDLTRFDAADVDPNSGIDISGGFRAVADPGVATPDTLVLGSLDIFQAVDAGSDAVVGFDELSFTDLTFESAFPGVDPNAIEITGSREEDFYEIVIDRDLTDPSIEFYYTDYYGYYYFSSYLDIDSEADVFNFSRLTAWQAYVTLDDMQTAEVIGGERNDILHGNDASNIFLGNLGDDDLRGYAGQDELHGGDGADHLNGGEDSDSLFGDDGNDALYGWTGDDEMYGGNGHDDLFGWDGNDLLDGGSGDDLLVGDFGNDELNGGPGNDRLFSDIGKDLLTGGTGRDRFQYSTATEHDETSGSALSGVLTSPTGDAAEQDDIVDFASADDMIVISEAWFNDDPDRGAAYFGNTDIFFWTAQGAVHPEVRFKLADGSYIADLTMPDHTGQIDDGNFIFRVIQYSPQESKDLSRHFYQGETTGASSRDGSYEVIFIEPGDSNGADFDVFTGTTFLHDGTAGFTTGQDKFSFTLMPVEAGTEEAGGIHFIEFANPGDTFTAPGNNSVGNFFIETDQNNVDIQRAIKVEYQPGQLNVDDDQLMVYFDADGDGNFSLNSDLFFRIDQPLRPDGSTYNNDVAASDLYADPDGDGSGTGIFILNADQYNLWYS